MVFFELITRNQFEFYNRPDDITICPKIKTFFTKFMQRSIFI